MALNETNLEKRFALVSTSQGSIQSLSFFCLHYKNHHKKIAQVWLRSLQKAKVSHRLTLIYLANDIVQNAKRKNVLSFIDDFKTFVKEAIPHLRDEKIKKSVERVFSIWQDRNIYDNKFTTELKNILNDTGRAPAPPDTFAESLNRLKNYERLRESGSACTKSELDEREKLAKQIEDTLTKQKRLLKDAEEQLVTYKSQLEFVSSRSKSD